MPKKLIFRLNRDVAIVLVWAIMVHRGFPSGGRGIIILFPFAQL